VRERLICLRSAHLWQSETHLSRLLSLAYSCYLNVTLTKFSEKERKIPDTSRSFPCTAWLLFPSLTTTAQRVYANKTSTLGSIISYHNYFHFDGECVLPSPDYQSHWKLRTHAYTHIYTKNLAGLFELSYKKNLLQLQTARLSFCHSAQICKKTIQR